RTARAAVVAQSMLTIASGAELKAAGDTARARASMPANATGIRTARPPATAGSVLPATKSIPATEKARPISPAEAPSARSCTGTRKAETAVVTPATTIAATAEIVVLSVTVARRLAPTGGAGGAGAGILSSPRAAVIAARVMAAARNGIVRPKYCTPAPDRAGPTAPPTPAMATEPPRLQPPRAAPARQEPPAALIAPQPIPNTNPARGHGPE